MSNHSRSRSENEVVIINLHVAEYQALTTRNTYLVTLQFSLWPVLLLFLTLVSQVWNSIPKEPNTPTPDQAHRVLVWSTAAALQLIGAAWVQLAWEQLSNLIYIEEHVRSDISHSLVGSKFWQYEVFLAKQRGSAFVGDYWLTVGTIVLIPLLIVFAMPFMWIDYIGLGASMFLCAFLVIKTIGAMNLRRELAARLLRPVETQARNA